jgi:hypothetical protein
MLAQAQMGYQWVHSRHLEHWTDMEPGLLGCECIRATLSSVRGAETSGGIRSINMGTIIQEREYYAPSRGIRREKRMKIPKLGETLYTKW